MTGEKDTLMRVAKEIGQDHRRHPQEALTDRAVQTAKAGDCARRIADGGGLYLYVTPGGAKSWVLRTVVKGKRCDLGLGGVTFVSLAEAREEARRLRRIARTGGDPIAERRHERLNGDRLVNDAKEKE